MKFCLHRYSQRATTAFVSMLLLSSFRFNRSGSEIVADAAVSFHANGTAWGSDQW